MYVTRVSKIQRNAEISNGLRCTGRDNKKDSSNKQQQQHRDINDDDFSTRCGAVQVSVGEVESPDQTHRDTNESDNNISSCSTLDIGKVENLTLQQLESQVRELSQRLQQAEKERTDMKQQLEECSAEKELCFRRLEIVSAAHECRITEMHCVIAELSKKLRAKQESIIMEEQEPEGSEISFQEGSVYNSELNLTNPDAECQTDPLDGCDYSAGEGLGNEDGDDNNPSAEMINELKLHSDTVNKGQVEALQEEILHLKAQIALLQSEIANATEPQPAAVVEEQQSIEIFNDDVEANDSNYSKEQFCFVQTNEKSSRNCESSSWNIQKDPPIPKMAERVILRCSRKSDINNPAAATDLCNSEIENSKQINSLTESYMEPSEITAELQRLQRKVELLNVRNTVLNLNLDECKEHCEHLYLLCGKYESNAIALQSALNCSDRAIEAYDVMLALLESKLALIKDKSEAMEESRKAVESVARHLLDRLESEKNVCENSLGPWQNTFSIPDKVSIPWTPDDDSRLRYHVSKLKGRRSAVQNTTVNLESPFSDFYEKSRMKYETENEMHKQKQERTFQLDVEMAVLTQELLNLREENIGLKAKAEESEKEKQYATDRIGILQEALKQLQLQIELTADSNSLFYQGIGSAMRQENRVSYSEAEHAALTEQQLVEALTRESELKGRIQTLIASVSESQKISDEKYEQLHTNIRELQRSNLGLNEQLEQNKRKYQMRIRKLEQKLMEISGRNASNSGDAGEFDVCLQPTTRPIYKSAAAAAATTAKNQVRIDNVPETTL